MAVKTKLPPELDAKNAEDYLAYSKKIEGGLEWIKKNLDRLSLNKVSVSTLSKRTGIHRNTLGNHNGRGAYVIPQINRLKNLKRQRAEVSNKVLTEEDKNKREISKIQELEKQLELQREETGRKFLQAENFKNKLRESEAALKKLAQQNLMLQKGNEELLKRTSGKVTNIATKFKCK